MLLDAATLYFRAFYALPASLRDPHGRPNNAIRGFFDGLRTIRDRQPYDRIVACWDEDWRPAWRVELLPSYKTHRAADGDETPDELAPQVPVIAELCAALGIAVVGAPSMEADDVIAALALAAEESVDIVSGDRDLTQLVSDADHRRLLYLGTGVGTHTVYDEALVLSTYGVRADQYADFATLRGDPSDGIPGAPGIGAKTAASYLQRFGDLDGIFAAAAAGEAPITKTKAQTLLEHEQMLRATNRVVRLSAGSVQIPPVSQDATTARKLAAEYGVTSTVERWLSSLFDVDGGNNAAT